MINDVKVGYKIKIKNTGDWLDDNSGIPYNGQEAIVIDLSTNGKYYKAYVEKFDQFYTSFVDFFDQCNDKIGEVSQDEVNKLQKKFMDRINGSRKASYQKLLDTEEKITWLDNIDLSKFEYLYESTFSSQSTNSDLINNGVVGVADLKKDAVPDELQNGFIRRFWFYEDKKPENISCVKVKPNSIKAGCFSENI